MAVLILYLLHVILCNFSVFSLSSLCVGAVKPPPSLFPGPFVTGDTIFLSFPSPFSIAFCSSLSLTIDCGVCYVLQS